MNQPVKIKTYEIALHARTLRATQPVTQSPDINQSKLYAQIMAVVAVKKPPDYSHRSTVTTALPRNSWIMVDLSFVNYTVKKHLSGNLSKSLLVVRAESRFI